VPELGSWAAQIESSIVVKASGNPADVLIDSLGPALQRVRIPNAMSQLIAIKLEVLGLLLAPFLTLAITKACGFTRHFRLNPRKKAAQYRWN
jgi:hypothetical protein